MRAVAESVQVFHMSSAAQKSVAIVEDEYILALDIRLILESMGFSVPAVCISGEEIIDFFRTGHADLILMDITLGGGIDGIETARRIRREKDIPVIYLTGMSDEESVLRARETSPYGFIYKPFEQKTLYANIETALYRHKLEKDLKRSEERYRLLYNGMIDGFARTTMNGDIVEFNEAFRKMLGYSAEQMTTLSYRDITPEKWLSYEAELIRNEVLPLGFSQVYEKEYIRSDGSVFPVELRIYLVKTETGGNEGMWATVRDISARKRAESDRIRIQQQLLAALDHTPAGIIIAGAPDVTLRLFNKAACSILLGRQLSPGELFPKDASEATWTFFQKDGTEIPMSQNPLTVTIRQGKIYSSEEIRVVRRDGSEAWILVNGAPIFDSNGVITEGIVVFLDITELRHSEEAFLASKKKYSETIEMLPLGIYECDMTGRITFANRQSFSYFGMDDDDFHRGVSIFDVIIPEQAEKARGMMQKHLRNEPIGDFEYTGRRKDGTTFPLEIHSSLIWSKDRPAGMRGVLYDLSFRKKMEEELFKATKLESVGVLAGGIAHDFNNILTAMLGNISLSKMNIDKTNQVYDLLNDAEKAGFRAKDLTQQLLTFSRGGSPVKENMLLPVIIRDSAEFVLRGSVSKCSYRFPPDLRPVHADKGQISQVIQNLIINANQAMPKGGTIEVTAFNKEIGRGENPHLTEGHYVGIAIKDSGVGIPETLLKNIFDPYFTTKQTGSGLGLSICYSIIRNHGGLISVESEEGKGTTFTVMLPATDGMPDEVNDENGQQFLHGTGRILVMDDDSMIHDLLHSLLTAFGYTVEFANDGEEALSLYDSAQKNHRPFDLVIMDLTIPGRMGGKEAMELLKAKYPSAKAIVSSGYSTDPVMIRFADYGFSGILPKPFTAEDLLEAVKELIP